MSKVTWTIRGKLKVRSQFPEVATAFGDSQGDVPLAGVRVRVSAKELSWDPDFENWGEVFTASDGSFTLTNMKDKSQRFFRVEVLFEDNKLSIYPGTGLDLPGSGAIEDQTSAYLFKVHWMNVWQDQEKKGPGVVDFHDLTFSAEGGEERNNHDQRRHADLWFLTHKVMSHLDSLGDGLGFIEGRFGMKYPQNDPNVNDKEEEAYADPVRRIIFYIHNSQLDSFEIQTVMHELMHMRNYHHSTGELGLAWELLIHRSTHDGRQDVTWTGFHEASAETFKTELYRQLFGKGATIYMDEPAERRPFTRAFLKKKGIHILGDIDHFEYGWISTFNLLLCGKLDELDMNGSGEFAEPQPQPKVRIAKKSVQFSFADLLRAFDPLPPKFPDQIDISEMTLTGFFHRLSAVNPEFDATVQSAYKQILDPKETRQPYDLLPVAHVPLPKTTSMPRH